MYIKVATTDELSPGQCKTVRANGKMLALYNVNGNYYATDDVCPHNGGPLGEGMLDGTTIVCPWHHWQFEVTTGKNATNPAMQIDSFAVKVEGNDILVEI
jgi:nitrite reductase/ring-hydroxylating ferredoxin subunit